MIFTDNEDIYHKLLSIRIHGKGNNKYDNIRIGINGRIDTIQCAILLAKFEIYDNEIKLRQEIADRYTTALKQKYVAPFVKQGNKSIWAQYCIQHPDREIIQNKLSEKQIPTMIYYPKPLHLQTAFKDLNYSEGDFSISESVSKKIFALPMYPYLKISDQNKIISELLN